jgi:hypothetical protein
MAKRNSNACLEKVVSGGQTGVDRGALDAAIAFGIPHGGWCPKGRIAEDGIIPQRYKLKEMESGDYPARTEQNVVDSDATLILYHEQLNGGTELTYRLTRKHDKPCKLIDLTGHVGVADVKKWLVQNNVRVLNVAGPRESSAAGIAEQTKGFLHDVLSS